MTPLGFEPRPADEVSVLAKSAYGEDVDPPSLLRGLEVVAQALNRRDLGRAMVAAVRLRLPELDWDGAIRMTRAEHVLAKYDPNEPRDWRGRWTTGGAAGPAAPQPVRSAPRRDEAANDDDVASQSERDFPAREVRPDTLTPVSGEEETWPGRNRPSGVIDDLKDVFPSWFPDAPVSAILAPIDGVLNLSGPGEAANEAATRVMRDYLIAQIKAVNPHYVHEWLDPGDMPTTWQGRANLINGLLAERAAALYKFRGDFGPLQVETLRFLQRRVDKAYRDGVGLFNQGDLKVRLSREEAIGNYVDRKAREDLRDLYNSLNIPYRPNSPISVNSREYDSSEDAKSYRIPDSKVGDVAFEVTLTQKLPNDPQIRGFFNSDFKPSAVVIIRPNQLGGSYLIPRPSVRSRGI
jgi:hypothetical protein